MGTRDRDGELPDFLPDLATIRREMDPAYGEKKLREALDSRELEKRQVAAEEVKEASKESPSPYEVPIEVVPGGRRIDAPRARTQIKAVPRSARRKLPAWAVYILAVMAVIGPVAMVLALVKSPPPPETKGISGVASGSESASPKAIESVSPAATEMSVGVGADAGADGSVDAQVESAPLESERPLLLPRPVRSKPVKGSGPMERVPVPKTSAASPMSEPAPTSTEPPMAPDMAP